MLLKLSLSQTACDWMTESQEVTCDSIHLTAKWGDGGDNVATRHYYYIVMCDSCAMR